MIATGRASNWRLNVTGMIILLLVHTNVSFGDLLRADLNKDGRVDGSDISILHGEMGREDCSSSPCRADISGDGRVNSEDLEILKGELKSVTPPAGRPAAPAVDEGEQPFFEVKPPEEPPADAGEEEQGEADNRPSASRFIDNKNGTITDIQTGLVWTKNADLHGDTLLFHQALNYIEEMNRGELPNFGFTDWRLPTLAELRSLVDYTRLTNWEHTLPEGHPFENVQSLGFNSTAYLNAVEHSWFVSLYCRVVGHNVDSCYGRVWAVRGGRGSTMQ